MDRYSCEHSFEDSLTLCARLMAVLVSCNLYMCFTAYLISFVPEQRLQVQLNLSASGNEAQTPRCSNQTYLSDGLKQMNLVTPCQKRPSLYKKEQTRSYLQTNPQERRRKGRLARLTPNHRRCSLKAAIIQLFEVEECLAATHGWGQGNYWD